MYLVHEPADGGDPTVLAREVELADTALAQGVGLMFRRSLPAGHAMAFRFDRQAPRTVHTAFVPFPLDVVWVTDGVVARIERLRPWLGLARSPADLLVELPAGAAAGVDPGDRLGLAAAGSPP